MKNFNCLNCNKDHAFKGYSYANKYCNNQCQKDYEYKEAIKNWEIVAPGKNRIKKYLAETFGRKCSVCSIEEWNGKEIVFDLEHKDGNSENNNKINLCLICPNCHSQTDSYKGANRGNGRHSRRQRYAEGKSF
jgi:hypothetical protein